MHRNRTIAASPTRSGAAAWAVVTRLLADTLERSDAIPEASVEASLARMGGLAAALIAGGHFDATPLVLVDKGLHVSIRVVRGDQALSVQENLEPIPGGASATAEWVLHMSAPTHLAGALTAAAEGNSHVSTSPAPEYKENTQASVAGAASSINRDALRALGGQ